MSGGGGGGGVIKGVNKGLLNLIYCMKFNVYVVKRS